jgi:hypothetical protein
MFDDVTPAGTLGGVVSVVGGVMIAISGPPGPAYT